MIGGLLSAIIVGVILEKGDLYANIAAESYVQGADDAEFWKNMSEEEKKKAEKMLSKIKEAKAGGVTDAEELKKSVLAAIEGEDKGGEGEIRQQESSQSATTTTSKEVVTKASNDIFSDYGD